MTTILYHYPISPFSRKVRLMLAEKGINFELKTENFWERRRKFLAMNPASQVPVLIEENYNDKPILLSESTAICEYLEEKYPEPQLIGSDILERAEIRRVSGWFNNKFYYEVTKYIVDEKVYKFLRKQGEPNSHYLRAAKNNIIDHLDYIAFLLRTRKWLAGEKFSLADITAVAQLSVLDFLGDVPWDHNQEVKEWYCVIKSRPSFRQFFDDYIPGLEPSKNYKCLDF
ncbi:MAG: glutathione S-transferase family protein [Rickettsiales bacterium]|nr:glutathione S-transferase family protein [Rickettsiales bacterium]